MNDEILTKAYHSIITELEIPKVSQEKEIKSRKIYTIRNVEYYLTKDEIITHLRNKLRNNGLEAERVFMELNSRGFLVELGDRPEDFEVNRFRTLHMDILVRSSEIRTMWSGLRYITTPRFMWDFVKTASERDRIYLPEIKGNNIVSSKLYASIRHFFGDSKLTQDFISILKEYLGGGLDGYQAYALASMLESKSKVHVITAPTGAGKTEIFFLYILAWLMKNKYQRNKARKVVLIYPRRTLSIDQSGRLIRLLKIASEHGYTFSFGLRDGHTQKKKNVRDGEPFRGIRCPECSGKLVYDIKSDSVRCSLCGTKLSFVKSTKEAMGREKPDVIVTTMWCLETRMLDNNPNDLNVHTFSEVGMVVVDEAHEYTGLGGGLVHHLIRLLTKLANDDINIIISSATIPSATDFASKLTGVPKSEIQQYDFTEIRRKLQRSGITFSGERLVLVGIFRINPRYSWSTYCQLWAVMMAFLNYAYSLDKRKIYKPQSLIFINNIKELRRTRIGYEENISLGEPRDHIIGPKEVGNPLPSLDPFCYWHFLAYKDRERVANIFNERKKLEELMERVEEMHSLVKDPKIREKVISALESGKDLGVIFSTSSLELGVDYPNVSFILNVGFSNPISLVQRIGRGGRKTNSLRTVLGIILFRNLPTETISIYRPDLKEKLSPSYSGRGELFIAADNPQVVRRAKLVESISLLAKRGIPTYASGKAIKSISKLQEFLSEVIECLKYMSGEEE